MTAPLSSTSSAASPERGCGPYGRWVAAPPPRASSRGRGWLRSARHDEERACELLGRGVAAPSTATRPRSTHADAPSVAAHLRGSWIGRRRAARRARPRLMGMSSFRLAGVDVPRIGLGTNRLTTGSPHVTFIREAVAAGVRHIDTAHLYTGGDSERAIGEALAGAAEEVLVATKGGFRGARPEVLEAEIEQSLRSLRTDAIGLYYLHRVDPETPLEESLGAIKAYVDRGAIRHVGVSEVSVEQIERARRVVPIAAVQNEYNVANRDADDVVDHCEREGIAFVPFYPLEGAGENTEKLAWLLRRSPVVLPIPGTLSIEHLRENLAVLTRS